MTIDANVTAPSATPSAPAPSAPAEAVVAPVSATPAHAETPVVAPPASDPSSAPEAPPSEKAATSLLGGEPPAEAPKADAVVEVKPETKIEETSQSAEPAPLPTFEAFKLPDGSPLDEGKLGDFTKELAEFELTSKADHVALQEFGQKLLDRHTAEIQRMADYYKIAWENQKNGWKDAFEKDQEIGGNRANTTINAALQFIRTHGGTEAQQQEFRQLMDTTGVGNHPALIRVLAKANSVLSEGKPLAGTKAEKPPTSKVSRRYGG